MIRKIFDEYDSKTVICQRLKRDIRLPYFLATIIYCFSIGFSYCCSNKEIEYLLVVLLFSLLYLFSLSMIHLVLMFRYLNILITFSAVFHLKEVTKNYREKLYEEEKEIIKGILAKYHCTKASNLKILMEMCQFYSPKNQKILFVFLIL